MRYSPLQPAGYPATLPAGTIATGSCAVVLRSKGRLRDGAYHGAWAPYGSDEPGREQSILPCSIDWGSAPVKRRKTRARNVR